MILVVLNPMLPGLDGVQLRRRPRRLSDVRVVVLAATTKGVDRIVGLSVHSAGYRFGAAARP